MEGCQVVEMIWWMAGLKWEQYDVILKGDLLF